MNESTVLHWSKWKVIIGCNFFWRLFYSSSHYSQPYLCNLFSNIIQIGALMFPLAVTECSYVPKNMHNVTHCNIEVCMYFTRLLHYFVFFLLDVCAIDSKWELSCKSYILCIKTCSYMLMIDDCLSPFVVISWSVLHFLVKVLVVNDDPEEFQVDDIFLNSATANLKIFFWNLVPRHSSFIFI